MPKEARGDILSLMSCNDSGVERLENLLTKFQLPNLDEVTEFIYERSKFAMEKSIGNLPQGIYTNQVYY